MSRPESTADLRTTTVTVGTVSVGELATLPEALHGWAELAAAFADAGGTLATDSHDRGTVSLIMPMDEPALARQLAIEQRNWDAMRDLYDRHAADRSKPSLAFEAMDLTAWCKREDLTVPWEAAPDAEATP